MIEKQGFYSPGVYILLEMYQFFLKRMYIKTYINKDHTEDFISFEYEKTEVQKS